jgi:hypothetical protein
MLDFVGFGPDRAPKVTRRCTVLKKTGIIVAVVAAATVAAAPLAFAGESNKSHHAWSSDHHSSSADYDYKVDNSVDRDQHNECAFAQQSRSDRESLSESVLGVVPLVGDQSQMLNCTNVGDVTVLDLGAPAPAVAPAVAPAAAPAPAPLPIP